MTMARLDDSEVRHYAEQGYLIPRYRLPQPRVEQMREALERLIRDNPGVRPEKLVSAHVVGKDGGPNPEGVKGRREFLELAMHTEIVDMVEQLIGPDIILWGCHVFCKPAGDGLETPWHQDGQYWPIRPLANCTVWVALDPSTKDNGCLRVIPKSHAARVTHPHLHEDRQDLVLEQRTVDDAFDERSAVDLELQPGQMSMHDIYMIHGARTNTSTQRRAGVALRYMPATSLFDRSLKPVDGKSGIPVAFAQRPLWLLRGRDVTGRNDFSVGFEPTPDANADTLAKR
jgi:ectoine hydroxylase-related dioxygenase (phytanoyl-CoA dioxygenase family)